METLILEGSTINPRVCFEPFERTLEISGYSRPENVRDFYMPIIEWIEEYMGWILKNQNADESIEPITFKFKYIYFNSSSAKFIHDIMVVLSDMQENKIPIKVYWFFDEDDDELREAGEELSDMAKLPFHYVEINRL